MPKLPEGFEIETEAPVSTLPEGFELETPQAKTEGPKLPPGFELETEAPFADDNALETQLDSYKKKMAQEQEAAYAKEAEIAKQEQIQNQPENWSSTRFKKEAPKPQTPEEQAMYDATLAKKELQEEQMTEKLLPADLKKTKDLEIAGPVAGVKPIIEKFSEITTEVSKNPYVQSFMSGLSKANENLTRIPAFAYDALALPQNVLEKMTGWQVGTKSPDWLMDNPLSTYFDKASESYNYKKKGFEGESLETLVKKKEIGRAGEYLLHSVVENIPNQMMIILGSLSGASQAQVLGTMGTMQAAASNKEARTKGLDPINATADAVLNGGFEAIFEKAGTFGLLKEAQEIFKSLGKATGKEVLKATLKSVMHTTIGEANEEFFTQLAQDLTNKVYGVEDVPWKEFIPRAIEAGAVGAISGFGMTSPAAAVSGMNLAKQQKQLDAYNEILGKLKEIRERESIVPPTEEPVKNPLEVVNIEPPTPEGVPGEKPPVKAGEVAKKPIVEGKGEIFLYSPANSRLMVGEDGTLWFKPEYGGKEIPVSEKNKKDIAQRTDIEKRNQALNDAIVEAGVQKSASLTLNGRVAKPADRARGEYLLEKSKEREEKKPVKLSQVEKPIPQGEAKKELPLETKEKVTSKQTKKTGMTPKEELIFEVDKAIADLNKKYADLSTEDAAKLPPYRFKMGKTDVKINATPEALARFKQALEKGNKVEVGFKSGKGGGKKIMQNVKLSDELGFVKIPIPEITKEGALTFYQKYVNRNQSLTDITAEAKAKGMVVRPGEDPGLLAQAYLGIGPRVQEILDRNTFKMNPDGSVTITGEGLKPILDDFSKEAKTKDADEDLVTFLIANRYIKDLQRPKAEWDPSFIASSEQTADSRAELARLAQKYKDLAPFEKAAQRLYGFQKRVLHLQVDAGNMSQELYDKILGLNPNYVPFDRILGEEEPGAGGTPKNKAPFTGARSFTKRIRGSEKEIYDPIESIIKNTYRSVDVATRNQVARSLAKLSDILPDKLSPVDIPMIPVAKIQHKAAVDLEFMTKLSDFAKSLGARTTRGGQPGINLGMYYPGMKLITSKFATPSVIPAHETGHFFDDKYKLKQRFYKRNDKRGNTKAVAEELIQHMKNMGESANRQGKAEERFADGFEWWLVHRDLAKKDLPLFSQEMARIISEIPELKPLLAMRPSVRVDLEAMNETIFGQSPFVPKGPIIEYFDNGEKFYMKVTPNLYAAMKGMNEISIGLVTKILSIPATWLRVGATITPEFMVRNPFRDQFTAFLQTKIGFKPFIDTFYAIGDILGSKDIYHEWLRSGAAYSTFTELSRENLSKKLKDLKSNVRLIRHLNIITTAQEISQLFEQATRVAVYKAARAKGATSIEAAIQSREATVDFGRRGSQTKDVSAVIPFFNAGIQGTDVTIRSAVKDPVGLSLKALILITIPSILLYLYNRQDKDYEDIPRWQKDLFWVFKYPGTKTYVRIPKPFLYGMLFGSSVERFMEYVDKKDPKAFKGLFNSLVSAATPVSAEDPMGSLIPTAFKGLIENTANWNFFRQAPVVPNATKRYLPEFQTAKYTSETAKAISHAARGLPDNFLTQNIKSPAKLENIVTSMTGGSGRYAFEGSDMIGRAYRDIQGMPNKPKRPLELSDIPLVKGFVTRPVESSPESVNKFYDKLETLGAAYDTYKKLIKTGRPEEARSVLKENPDLKYGPAIKKVSTQLSKITAAIDQVSAQKNMSEEKKRTVIDSLETKKMLLARTVIKKLG
jgi:hypothetical protein